ncbi:MAG: hypothetical protein GY841_20315 [FCB group bacterium]|nr:hypothetical protein [FCB group bacterium]
MAMEICDYLNQRVPMEEDFCFVIMPFDEKLNEVFHRGIKPIVEELGFRCRRADQHLGSTPILYDIFDDIMKAKVIIADLTDANPNVFWELGICHTLKRNVILLKRAGSHVPFDLHGFRHFEYEDRLGGEGTLRDILKGTLAHVKDDREAELFDKPSMTRNLKKGCHLWKSGQEIVIGFEEFVEIVLGLDHLSPTEDEIAFLCRAAAYFGKFMRRMSEVAHGHRTAVYALAVEAATGLFTRVPWRAATMLEHFDRNLVERELREFTDEIVNKQIFPKAILEGSTIFLLNATVNNPKTPKETREKLAEVLRQIRSEYGT